MERRSPFPVREKRRRRRKSPLLHSGSIKRSVRIESLDERAFKGGRERSTRGTRTRRRRRRSRKRNLLLS